MKCPVCGGECEEGSPLCSACGTSLDRTVVDARATAPRPTTAFSKAELASRQASAAVAAAPSVPRGDIAARVLLSSVLQAPIRLEEGSFYRIGRDRASDICFPSTHVSRVHAEITFEKGHWVIGDLGSRNGTFVNGERVFKKSLRDTDKVGIGHFEIHYRELSKGELEEMRNRKSDKLADTLKLTQDAIGFFGDVKKLSVVEVVQLLGQNRKTGILSIHEEKGAPERRLCFLEGAIVHAEFGTLEGDRAALTILRTREGKFAFRPTPEGGERITVETPTATILFQALEAMNSGTPAAGDPS